MSDLTNLIEFPSRTNIPVDSKDCRKFTVVMQSVITIEVEAEAIDSASAKTIAIDQFRNNGIMDGKFSQTKYKIISVEGVDDRVKCN